MGAGTARLSRLRCRCHTFGVVGGIERCVAAMVGLVRLPPPRDVVVRLARCPSQSTAPGSILVFGIGIGFDSSTPQFRKEAMADRRP